jgi:cytolysin (calcineurin-like family phosphatase)
MEHTRNSAAEREGTSFSSKGNSQTEGMAGFGSESKHSAVASCNAYTLTGGFDWSRLLVQESHERRGMAGLGSESKVWQWKAAVESCNAYVRTGSFNWSTLLTTKFHERRGMAGLDCATRYGRAWQRVKSSDLESRNAYILTGSFDWSALSVPDSHERRGMAGLGSESKVPTWKAATLIF